MTHSQHSLAFDASQKARTNLAQYGSPVRWRMRQFINHEMINFGIGKSNMNSVYKPGSSGIVDSNAVKKKVDLEVRQLSSIERQFVKAVVICLPDCPLWFREQVLLSLSGGTDLDPTSPAFEAIKTLTVGHLRRPEIATSEIVAQRELLHALNLTEKVVIAAEFLKRLAADISLSITKDESFIS